MKYLSINDIKNSPDESVWVINRSVEVLPPHGGQVQIQISIPNENPRTVTVPRTWIPIDVARFVPKEYLIKSMSFRDTLDKLIAVISPEDAERILGQRAARSEQARLVQKQADVEAANATRGISKNTTVTAHTEDGDEEEKPAKKVSVTLADEDEDENLQDSPGSKISANFIAWVSSLNDLDLDEAKSKARMRFAAGLEEHEARFIIANCSHASIVKSVKKSFNL